MNLDLDFVYSKNTSRKVKYGEIISITMDELPPFDIIINLENIDFLNTIGLIKVKCIAEAEQRLKERDKLMDTVYNGIIDSITNKMGCTVEDACWTLGNLYKVNPMSVVSTFLKEIAISLDEKYPDHISEAKTPYIISTVNGDIIPFKNLNKVKNFKNFAIFRSSNEANLAKNIIKNQLGFEW